MKVTLLKDGHTHAGRERKAGDEIDVKPEVAAWMAHPDRALIAPIPTNTKAATAAKRED